jgi:2-haloacid dehalogenase
VTSARLDFSPFEALTFDCYGTLIDWETGILSGLRIVLASRGITIDHDALLEAYARHESDLERGDYMSYRGVLAECLVRVCAPFDVQPTPSEVDAFAGSVGEWPAFADSAAALGRLAQRYRLGVITNCDDDLFAASNLRLGVTFDWVITAQQARSYKPNRRNFELAFVRMGVPRQRVLHVAQSLYHDHVPAHELGVATAWIDRRRGKPGSGATPPAEASPDISAPDMASFAELALR